MVLARAVGPSGSPPSWFCAPRRRRLPWIFGPRMLWVTAAQLLSHLRICSIPEAAQIARELNRAAVRREEREQHRLASRTDAWRLAETEQFLQLDRCRHAAILAVLEPNRPAARYGDCLRRVASERAQHVGGPHA